MVTNTTPTDAPTYDAVDRDTPQPLIDLAIEAIKRGANRVGITLIRELQTVAPTGWTLRITMGEPTFCLDCDPQGLDGDVDLSVDYLPSNGVGRLFSTSWQNTLRTNDPSSLHLPSYLAELPEEPVVDALIELFRESVLNRWEVLYVRNSAEHRTFTRAARDYGLSEVFPMRHTLHGRAYHDGCGDNVLSMVSLTMSLGDRPSPIATAESFNSYRTRPNELDPEIVLLLLGKDAPGNPPLAYAPPLLPVW